MPDAWLPSTLVPLLRSCLLACLPELTLVTSTSRIATHSSSRLPRGLFDGYLDVVEMLCYRTTASQPSLL